MTAPTWTRLAQLAADAGLEIGWPLRVHDSVRVEAVLSWRGGLTTHEIVTFGLDADVRAREAIAAAITAEVDRATTRRLRRAAEERDAAPVEVTDGVSVTRAPVVTVARKDADRG